MTKATTGQKIRRGTKKNLPRNSKGKFIQKENEEKTDSAGSIAGAHMQARE